MILLKIGEQPCERDFRKCLFAVPSGDRAKGLPHRASGKPRKARLARATRAAALCGLRLNLTGPGHEDPANRHCGSLEGCWSGLRAVPKEWWLCSGELRETELFGRESEDLAMWKSRDGGEPVALVPKVPAPAMVGLRLCEPCRIE